MRAITLYQADDGSRFNSADECFAYENMAAKVSEAMSLLKPKPENLASGDWIQQDKRQCHNTKNRLVDVARTIWTDSIGDVFRRGYDEIHPADFTLRIVTDGGAPKCFVDAWCRLATINWDTFREYNQMFFAMNPKEADGEEVLPFQE